MDYKCYYSKGFWPFSIFHLRLVNLIDFFSNLVHICLYIFKSRYMKGVDGRTLGLKNLKSGHFLPRKK